MGDFRADITIKANFWGTKDEIKLDVNWSPHDGVDYCVREFFEALYEKAMREYDKDVREYEEREEERKEKELYEKLKKKYEKGARK